MNKHMVDCPPSFSRARHEKHRTVSVRTTSPGTAARSSPATNALHASSLPMLLMPVILNCHGGAGPLGARPSQPPQRFASGSPARAAARAPTPPRHSLSGASCWRDGTNSRGHTLPLPPQLLISVAPVHAVYALPLACVPARHLTAPPRALPCHTGGAVRPRGHPDDVPGH